MILVRGPFLQADPHRHETCPRCEEDFLGEDGITTEEVGVLLCASCGAAETAAGVLVESGVAS